MWSCELTGRCFEVFYMFLPLQGLSSTDPRQPFGYPEHVILVAPQSVSVFIRDKYQEQHALRRTPRSDLHKLIPEYGSIVIFLDSPGAEIFTIGRLLSNSDRRLCTEGAEQGFAK